MALNLEKRLKKLTKKRAEIKLATQQKLLRRKREKYVAYYAIVAFITNIIAFFIWNSHIKHAFIDWWLLSLIGLIGGLILALPVLWLNRTVGAFFVIVMGLFSANIFLLFNQTYTYINSTKIVKRYVMKKRPPYRRWGASIDVRYNGNVVNFVIDEDKLDSSNYVTLTMKQGYFGYAFIDDYKISAE